MLTEVKADSPLILYLKKLKKAIVLEEIAREIETSGNPNNPKIIELTAVKDELEKLGAALCIPLFFEDKLIGLFNLGNKLSQDMYTDEDIDLLTTLSNQLAIAIENATLHEEMLQAQKQLLLADKLAALGRVAAGMAHEIKNPLASIKGMSQMVEKAVRENDQETLQDFKEVVPKELDRINKLVENLLKFGRPPKLQISSVNVNDVLENSLKLFDNQFTKNRIKPNKNLVGVPKIQADPEQLSQVFTNLFLNAIQSMPDGGQLNVTTAAVGDAKVAVEIADTGSGIEADKLSHIFDPFYSTKKTGSGLGLAITFRIIKEHRGTIEAESQVGQGAKFKIVL
ncbi:ATP-binding protein [Candidatus Margulisiibacteriota bacterium]